MYSAACTICLAVLVIMYIYIEHHPDYIQFFVVFFLIYSMSPNKHRNKALFQILTIKEYIIYIMAINRQYWLSVIVYCAFLQHLKNPVLPLSDSFCCYKPLSWRHEPANHPLWSDLLVFRLDNISVWIKRLNPFLNAGKFIRSRTCPENFQKILALSIY